MSYDKTEREFYKGLAEKCIEPRELFDIFNQNEKDAIADAIADAYITDTVPAIVRLIDSIMRLIKMKEANNEGD